MRNALKRGLALVLAIISVLTCMSVGLVPVSAAEAKVAEVKAVTFQNVKTGQYLNFDYGKLKNGTPVRVWDWDGSKEQRFDIDNIGGDTYRILTNTSSDFCIDVYRGNSKLKAGQKIDIWKTGDDTTAQNVKFYICDDGSVIIRMAGNTNLAISSNGKNAQLKLAKFSSSDKAQKWIIKDKNGNKVDVTGSVATVSVVTAGAYKKTNTVYTVSGNKYYLALTTRAYNGVAKNTKFWIDANNKMVTDISITNKLNTIYTLNDIFSTQNVSGNCRDIAKISGDYCDIYKNILATEKLGSIIGKGSGMLLSIGAGNAVSLKEATFDMIQEGVSVESIKTAAYLAMLQIYCNNAETYGNRAANRISNGITDYDTFLAFNYCYSEAFANFAAIKYLIGEDVVEMKNSSIIKEEWKYFKNVFWGFVDTFLPDMKIEDAKTLEAAIEAAKLLYELDGDIEKCFSVLQFADALGVTDVYEKTLKDRRFPEFNLTESVTLQNLAKAEIIPNRYVADDLQEKVNALKEKYKPGKIKTNLFERANAWECHGFACEALMDFWGTKKPTPSNKDYTYYKATSSNGYVSKIRPGDMVRYRNSDNFDHTIVVTNVDADYIYYADCNGDGKCTFKYEQKIKRSTLESKLKKVLIDQSVSTRGYVCHYKGNNL